MKKRIFSLLLMCTLIISWCPLQVKAIDGAYTPENYQMHTSQNMNILTVEEIMNMTDEELREMELLPFNQNARSVVDASYEVSSYNIQQKNGYYCGPGNTRGC